MRKITEVPADLPVDWVLELKQTLLELTHKKPREISSFVPKDVVLELLKRTEEILEREPALLELTPRSKDTGYVVVGDTHGQYHDVCEMLALEGNPSSKRIYVINGDIVDRGAWGIENLLHFCAWKIHNPGNLYLIRGNHESATCAIMYGFKQEVEAKYGKAAGRTIFSTCKKVFQHMPLAAVINRESLILHGGLFRKTSRSKGKRKRTGEDDFFVGSLEDIKRGSKGGMDPSGLGSSKLAADILWSDPGKESGLRENDERGIGLVFGPDVTEEFMRENDIKLIIRSHEGPDAREARPDMDDMLSGFTEDHNTKAGKLMTVFSAPDYPQFLPDISPRYHNKGSIAVLKHPHYAIPVLRQFEAVQPRPKASPYYELDVPDSDSENFELYGPDVSGMSGVVEDGDEIEQVSKRTKTS